MSSTLIEARVTATKIERRAKDFSRLLARRYGRKRRGRQADAVDEVILLLLEKISTSTEARNVLVRLKRQFIDWNEMRVSRVSDITTAMNGTRDARARAEHLKEQLNSFFAKRNSLDMSSLEKMSFDQAVEYLSPLRDVADYDVARILLYALHQAVMPVDDHVFRVTKRMGFVDKKGSRDRCRKFYESRFDERDIYQIYRNLVEHGERICLEEQPRCASCIIQRLCPTGR